MGCAYIVEVPYGEFSARFHEQAAASRLPINGTLELTFRCNLACRHCYCNLPVHDRRALDREMDTAMVKDVVDQLAAAGCLWLLVTGGEPLLRPDFFEIWRHAKKKGLLLTLFTNATLLTPEIGDFLREWPPFSVEVSVYGATEQTSAALTGRSDALEKCLEGLKVLCARNIPVKLKTMVTSLNRHELGAIKALAAELGVEFRFDAVINPRLDGEKIPCRYRLPPEEVVRLDMEDEKRRSAWQTFKHQTAAAAGVQTGKLFTCGAGVTSFSINPYAGLQVCGMLAEPAWDLRQGSFARGWTEFLPGLINQEPGHDYACARCKLYPLCGQCPGWAWCEAGDPAQPVEYLCRITHELADRLNRF